MMGIWYFYPGILFMKKHLFKKSLLGAVAILATLTFQSCQQRSTTPGQPKEPLSRPLTPSSQFNCDESEEGCNVEEAGEEAMIHVIEIDQPETTNVSEETSPKLPVLEAPTEVTAAPVEAPADTASIATDALTSETASVPAAEESTATIAVQGTDAVNPEQKEAQKKEQE